MPEQDTTPRTAHPVPTDMLWGASTSAFQVEGAHLEGGKGLTLADVAASAHRDRFADTSTAAGHYAHYEEDVALMADLGLRAYRMSISWARIFPHGDDAEPNAEGLAFYHRLFDALRAADVEPIVTLFHFDLPLGLHERIGGWRSREVVEHFERYARTCFEAFGSKVRYWLTINEQNLVVRKNHLMGIDAAAEDAEAVRHQMNHHMFLANARAIAACREMLPEALIGPTLAWLPSYPRTCSPQDVAAAADADRLFNTYASDVYIRGAYPTWYLTYLQENGWLPTVHDEDASTLKAGTPDFLGFNYYLTFAAEHCPEDAEADYTSIMALSVPGRFRYVDNPYLTATEYGWQIDPAGFYKSFIDLSDRYGLPLMVTENGIGTADVLSDDDAVHDDYRISYLRDHVAAMQRAIADGVKVLSYNVWSFIDVVSTSNGFSKRYGLVYIDRDELDPRQLRRVPKDSFYAYRDIIASNGVEPIMR